MNKKIVSFVLAVVMMLSLNVVAFAEETNTDKTYDAKSVETTTTKKTQATTTVTTTSTATYYVTIPSSRTLTFGETSDQSFGSLKLDTDKSRLHPGYSVLVELASMTKLVNSADSNNTIEFSLKDSDGAFSSVNLTTDNSTHALTAAVTAEQWAQALAGTFTGYVYFNISYAKVSA